MEEEARKRRRELVTMVLAEAVGSSLTPFVPVPFVDDYLLGRLLRRIVRKVSDHGGKPVSPEVAKAVVHGYTAAGAAPLGERALAAAARFVVRKVAVVLDVKKSHDVFGEAIAFALAFEVATRTVGINDRTAEPVGAAIHRANARVGSAVVEVLSRAGRAAFAAEAPAASDSSRLSRVADAIMREVDETTVLVDRAMQAELAEMR